jgi:hypothetical protein
MTKSSGNELRPAGGQQTHLKHVRVSVGLPRTISLEICGLFRLLVQQHQRYCRTYSGTNFTYVWEERFFPLSIDPGSSIRAKKCNYALIPMDIKMLFFVFWDVHWVYFYQ